MKKAVVLLSGGLDSATALYYARKRYHCVSLAFDYGQRHRREIDSARALARRADVRFTLLKISLPWKGSALLDKSVKLPDASRRNAAAIPLTYVPARNILFLSYALSYAETAGASAIVIGAHDQDYSGYPDCRPEFYRAFEQVIAKGTKAGVQHTRIKVLTPLIGKDKAGIIKLGLRLGVPYELTWSCYRGGRRPCGQCESCFYRAKGFKKAGLADPLLIE